jgi:ABC-2 type transport system permease protein
MTTQTLTQPGTASPARYRLSAKGILHAEWTKFWSLRSTWITLAVSLLLLVVFGVIAALTYDPSGVASEGPPGQQAASDAVGVILTGATFASLAIGVLGVLMSAGEYTTGSIRSTLAAVPSRLPVLWSKSVVFGAVALVAASVGALAAFAFGNPLLDGNIALNIGDDGVLRSLLGAGLYLSLVGVLGVALGALLRSSAGAITVLASVLLIVPGLTSLLPDSWADTISPYLPSNAGSAMMSLHTSSDSLGPWAGLAVFAGWVVLALAGAAYRLAKRDA